MVRELKNMDDVLVSSSVVREWHKLARKIAEQLRDAQIEIPDEGIRVNDDGTLTVFVKVPGMDEISMTVPPGHWAFRH